MPSFREVLDYVEAAFEKKQTASEAKDAAAKAYDEATSAYNDAANELEQYQAQLNDMLGTSRSNVTLSR